MRYQNRDERARIPTENKLDLCAVMSPEFMQAATNYDRVEQFLNPTGVAWRNNEKFEEITHDPRFDQYVDRHTEQFSTWEEMEDAATLYWLRHVQGEPIPRGAGPARLKRLDCQLIEQPAVTLFSS